ncbi:hypothetical protein BDB01DRAFT_831143 [Pilobolus umbonatus]|nr:hypothetical protein BDB01DRAFT_831143 [Pilobolus umbonatus]
MPLKHRLLCICCGLAWKMGTMPVIIKPLIHLYFTQKSCETFPYMLVSDTLATSLLVLSFCIIPRLLHGVVKKRMLLNHVDCVVDSISRHHPCCYIDLQSCGTLLDAFFSLAVSTDIVHPDKAQIIKW